MRRYIIALLGLGIVSSISFANTTPHPVTGKYYRIVHQLATWDEARVESSSQLLNGAEGHLITISDRVEDLIADDLGDVSELWIGLTDSTETSLLDGLNLSTLGTMELGDTSHLPLPTDGLVPTIGQRGGGFVWVTGEPLTYSNWRAGAPADFLGQADGVHTIVQGNWQDSSAGVSLGQPGIAGPVVRKYITEFETFQGGERLHLIERHPTNEYNNGLLPTLSTAETLLELPLDDTRVESETQQLLHTISLYDPDFGGGLADYVRAPFASDTPDVDDQDFAIRVQGQIEIPAAGDWTFGLVSANRTRLKIDENQFVAPGTLPQGPVILSRPDTLEATLDPISGGSGETFYFPKAGTYEFELSTLDSGHWSYVQLFGAQGIHAEFDPNTFSLVGDVLNGQIAIVSVGDYIDDGELTVEDIDALATAIDGSATDELYDLDQDGTVDRDDHLFWVKEIKRTWVGDSNFDSLFGTEDLVLAFDGGKFETGEAAGWSEGDWNGDLQFNTSDLIAAFQDGGYEAGTIYDAMPTVVPEPSTAMLLCLGCLAVLHRSRRATLH